MDTSKLKRFAQFARRSLIEQVAGKMALVLADDSAARRESPKAVAELEKQIWEQNKEQVIDKVAYVWFNRFCALRFMDVNHYTRIGVLSPAQGQLQPEMLAEAKMGHIDETMVPENVQQQIFALLDGTAPSADPQSEAYRLLVVAACNSYHDAMPFMFERIADYTELLMPDDLVSGNSILAHIREAMTPDACEDVEIIGWLYQFYISEKKDAVFAGLKKNKKIMPENIPAATQLFTPHWIVCYLVENSLGRLWMLNNPDSKLIDKMDYYIQPEQTETDFLRIGKPEEIKICDPACGSGHMLTYAFDLLYEIYESEGYDASKIPEKILTHNLYGIEIDERAGALAAFALTMKARGRHKRFFRKNIAPQICVLQNVSFEAQELEDYTKKVGRDLFSAELRQTLTQFADAKNFGSLIKPALQDVSEVARVIEAQDFSNDLLYTDIHQRVQTVLRMTCYLSPRYHVVVANPPYMGGKGMNGSLKSWAGKNYPASKSDLFAMFMERVLELSVTNGMMAMINMQSWMFLSSFEKLRIKLLGNATLLSMAHLGERGFDTIGGAVVSTTAFVFANAHHPDHKGDYLRLVDGGNEAEKAEKAREAIRNPDCGWFYRASAEDFSKIPGSPIAYWVSEAVRNSFASLGTLREISIPRQGNTTTDNARFVRSWFETSFSSIKFSAPNAESFNKHGNVWAPYNKGGGSRRWFGQNESVVNWENNGAEIKSIKHSVVANEINYFTPGITWSTISTTGIGFRYFGDGFIFDNKGASIFIADEISRYLLALLNTPVFVSILYQINPTVSLQPDDVGKFPVFPVEELENGPVLENSDECKTLAKSDWDSFETSWDFTTLPLLGVASDQWPVTSEERLTTSHYPLTTSLEEAYTKLRQHWQQVTDELQRLEQENNRIFIDAYGLQDELDEKVPLEEITLTCNPAYSIKGKLGDEVREQRLLERTMCEFLSYAVGCMFGRYSLDSPGLILANQGETLEDYLKQIPEPTFEPDEDNVIPILDGDWFPDDITGRFFDFLRTTFGIEHFEENRSFIERALGKDMRKYFLRDFYTDHVKRYKKRPIYWLFSSPKGSFNALIYMHRYRSDTVSTVLNDYLRAFRTKLSAHKHQVEAISISANTSKGEKNKALNEIDRLNRVIREIDEYERDTLYPLATRQIQIDLDDGVKVNYKKFGTALKKVPGLS